MQIMITVYQGQWDMQNFSYSKISSFLPKDLKIWPIFIQPPITYSGGLWSSVYHTEYKLPTTD